MMKTQPNNSDSEVLKTFDLQYEDVKPEKIHVTVYPSSNKQ